MFKNIRAYHIRSVLMRMHTIQENNFTHLTGVDQPHVPNVPASLSRVLSSPPTSAKAQRSGTVAACKRGTHEKSCRQVRTLDIEAGQQALPR